MQPTCVRRYKSGDRPRPSCSIAFLSSRPRHPLNLERFSLGPFETIGWHARWPEGVLTYAPRGTSTGFGAECPAG